MLTSACAPNVHTAPAERDDALVADLRYLSSAQLDGRATGSPGNDSAAAYLTRTYAGLGIPGLFPSQNCMPGMACRALHYQLFFLPTDVLSAAGIREDATASNIGAVLAGADPTLRGQFVVIGAHFDHLGRTGYGALDGGSRTLPHLGADDNASGTAAVLELARRFVATPTRRSIIFLHFGAEELGLFGSRAFVRRPPVVLDSIAAMLNLDMVGRMKRERVFVFGVGTSRAWKRLIEQANAGTKLWTDLQDALSDGLGTSDHENFVNVAVPALHFTTGTHEDWHTAEDRFARLNLGGERRVVDLVERLVRTVADSIPVLRPSVRKRERASGSGGS